MQGAQKLLHVSALHTSEDSSMLKPLDQYLTVCILDSSEVSNGMHAWTGMHPGSTYSCQIRPEDSTVNIPCGPVSMDIKAKHLGCLEGQCLPTH
jgi:hypothetical protein